jgi:hypothetical protein
MQANNSIIWKSFCAMPKLQAAEIAIGYAGLRQKVGQQTRWFYCSIAVASSVGIGGQLVYKMYMRNNSKLLLDHISM